MGSLLQEDFGGGIYRGRKAPPSSVFDAVNALINDEGLLFKRGTSTFVTNTSADEVLLGLRSMFFTAPNTARTFTLGSSVSASMRLVTGTDLINIPYPLALAPADMTRIVSAGLVAAWPVSAAAGVGAAQPMVYAGSAKSLPYNTGTVTATTGSRVVTGTGTSWAANTDAGMFLISGTVANRSPELQVVKTVDNDTQLTLTTPWAGPSGTFAYALWPIWFAGSYGDNASHDADYVNIFAPFAAGLRPYATYAGRRLLVGYGTRIAFTPIDNPGTQHASEYHELPADALIIGMDGLGETAFVFTTTGVWTIDGLFFDPVDDLGNIQHTVRQINKDLVLWGDPGVAAWNNGFVVPALGDVYLMDALGETQPITQGVRPLYRSYVKAGMKPGIAVVHRGHYLLPIISTSNNVIDVLVCRLDRGAAWTRWAGHAASNAYALQVGATVRSPKLYGIQDFRVTDLTNCLDGTGTTDADGITPFFTVISNDFDTGPGIRPNTVQKVRYVYETTGATPPTFTVASAVGPENATYTTAVLKRGGGASNGTDYSAWRIGRKAERIRFRFTTTSQVTSLLLRRLEVTIREAGQT